MTNAHVLRLEERVQLALARALMRRGRPVRVHPFPGVGTNGLARVRGRVLVDIARAPGRATRVPAWQAVRANLAQFLTVEVPGARVRVEVGERTEVAVADREGYLDVTLEGVTLTPGRHDATLTPVHPAGEPARGTVHVPHPAADLAVVSDIDDTIVDSGIAHGIVATITTALLRDSASRVPLTGAPELYRALARRASDGPPPPFFYLSTSPWNLVVFLQGFLDRHGFPSGPLLLTDWGPGAAGLFRIDTRTHKLAALRELAELLPLVRFVLIGDSGQQDAEIYAAFSLERPGRVAAVYIRRAGVLDDLTDQRLARSAQELAAAGVPFVVAVDSAAMLQHAQEHGLARR